MDVTMLTMSQHKTPHQKKKKCRTLRFQQHWYEQFPWLQDSSQIGGAVYFQCATANAHGLLQLEREKKVT